MLRSCAIATRRIEDAEKLAQILLHIEGIYDAVDLVEHENPEAGLEFARRLIMPVLLAKLRETETSSPTPRRG